MYVLDKVMGDESFALILILPFPIYLPFRVTWRSHLGHNLPDRKGSRYCINLVSIAGRPVEGSGEKSDGTEL
jgi:hypothetical protein